MCTGEWEHSKSLLINPIEIGHICLGGTPDRSGRSNDSGEESSGGVQKCCGEGVRNKELQGGLGKLRLSGTTLFLYPCSV